MHSRSLNVPYYLLGILALSIPFSFNIDKVAIILIAITGLWHFFKNRKGVNTSLQNLLLLLPPLVYFIAMLLGLTYSEDKNWGLKKIETTLPLLLLPLGVFMLIPALDVKKLSLKLMIFFSLGNLLAFIYAIISLTISPPIDFTTASDFFLLYSRDNLANFLGIHPIYLSLYNGLSIQILLYFLIIRAKEFNTLINTFWVFCLISSLVFIVLLGAKMALIASIITVVAWLIIYILINRKFLVGMLLTLLLVGLTVFSVSFIPNIKTRFDEIANTNLAPPQGLAHNSTNLRVGQFYCSLAVIKNKPFFGAGTGDYQHELNACYQQSGYSDVLYVKNYNSHNQYLQSWIMMGLLGIISLMMLILLPLFFALSIKDYLIVTCMMVILLCFLTESFLLVNKGVMVFSFFYALFIIRYLENKKEFSNHSTKKHSD